jgi:small subunit ribosomal protein S11
MAKQSSAVAASKAKAKKRVVKVEAVGEAHLNATFNNIIIV